MRARLGADASLVLVTLIWGSTFVVVKNTLDAIEPFSFVALRFWLAAIVLFAFHGRGVLRSDARRLRVGLLLGTFLLAGFLLQTLGLQLTTPARAGFLTGLCVVFVPLLQAVMTRMRPGRSVGFGIGLATIGMVVLSAPISVEELATGNWVGDLLVIGCAVAFAMHIVGVGHFARGQPAGASTSLQIFVAAVGATLLAIVARERTGLILDSQAWIAVVYVGAIATAPTFLIQNWAQRRTTATHTALIFSLEPVFAAMFSAQFYGEAIAPRVLFGGALILAGILVAELSPWQIDKEEIARKTKTAPT